MPPEPLRKRLPRWKKTNEVKNLHFILNQEKKPIRLETTGRTGQHFLARLRFTDGTIHHVIVKRYPRIDAVTSESFRRTYERGIMKLRKAGVRIPKMGLIKIPTPENPKGEYVLVTPFFGSQKSGSKITHDLDRKKEWPYETRRDAIEQLSRIANAGFRPSVDAIERFKNGNQVIVLDVDFIMNNVVFENERKPDRVDLNDSILNLHDIIEEFSKKNDRVYQSFFDVAMATLTGPQRKKMATYNRRYRYRKD